MSRRWILPVVILILLFTASLIHVEPGTWGVLRGVAGGRSFLLEPGLHLRLPFFQHLVSFPSGAFRLDFRVEGLSREGSKAQLTVHFEGLILKEGLLEFADRAAVRNGPTVVEDDLRRLVSGWAADHGLEELPAEPLEIRDRFRAAARASGFEIKTLTIARTGSGAMEAMRGKP